MYIEITLSTKLYLRYSQILKSSENLVNTLKILGKTTANYESICKTVQQIVVDKVEIKYYPNFK